MSVMATQARPVAAALAAAALAAAALGSLLAVPASAAGPVAVVGPDAVKVVARDGVGTATVAVSNEGPGTTIVWSVTLTGAGGAATVDVDPASSSLPANGVSVIDLTFRVTGAEGSLTGYLVGAVGAASLPAVLPLTIRTFPIGVPFGPIIVIGASILIAAAWVAACWRWDRLHDMAPGLDPDAKPAWDPTSWATTITGAGGLLTLLTLAGVLPSDTILFSREEFAALALVFAALGVLAPLAYGALLDPDHPATMVKVAMAITTAGALGQLATLDLLVADALGQSGGTPPLLVFGLIGVVCGALVLVYVRRSMASIVKGPAAGVGQSVTWPLL